MGDWLAARPFTLALSSGFFGFYAHAGMAAALFDRGLRPARLAGSSAGAIVAGALAGGLAPTELASLFSRLARDDFWDIGLGPGLLRPGRLIRLLGRLLPCARIEACPLPLAITVHDLARRRSRVVARGPLARAIAASCAVPFLFQPVRVGGRLCVDGGLGDREATASLAPTERAFAHHLVPRDARRSKPPVRDGLVALAIAGLPRPGPFAMERGKVAFEAARDATARALAMPVAPLVVVDAES